MTRRGLLALLLLVTMPLRGLAMIATPCCPIVAESMDSHAMAEAAMGAVHTAHDHDDHHATTPACCTVALLSTTAVPSSPDYVPPRARSSQPPTIAVLPTEPPERPPRPIA